MPIEHINKTDTLNEGREKINDAIDGANAADVTSQAADTKATQALANSESTQTQLDTIVIDGDSSVEAAQARVNVEDYAYNTLKERLDTEYTEINSQLADKVGHIELEETNQSLLTTTERLNESMVYINGRNAFSNVSIKQLEPTLVFIDDDTRNELYSLIFPVLQQKQVKLTSAAITSRIGVNPNTITLEQMREMRDSGLVEFVTHTHNHARLTELSEEEIDSEIKMSLEFLRREGINSSHIVYPYGAIDGTVRKIAAKYVKSGSKSNGLYYNPNSAIMDSFFIPRINFEESIATLKNRIDQIKLNSGLMLINIHSQYPEFTVSKFEEVIDYALSNNIKIKTMGEAFEDFSNLLELRNGETLALGISAAGYKHEVQDFIVQHPSNITKPSLSSPPEFYKDMKITTTSLNNTEASDWGLPGAGTLYTSRRHNDDYTSQTFEPIRSSIILRRSWNSSSPGSWTPFAPVYEAERHVRNIGPYTIPAGGSQNFSVDSDTIRNGRSVIATPNFQIPPYITYTFEVRTNGTGVLRIYNIDSGERTINAGNWVFTTV